MKRKSAVVVIFVLLLGFCFEASGNITYNDKNKCDCNESSVNIYPLSDDELKNLQDYINQKGWSFTVGRSSATERSIDGLCGLVEPDNWQKNAVFDPCASSGTLPDEFDWRDPNKNYVSRKCTTPIKYQGNCGSCWAFGTVAPLESAILIAEAVEEDLSEQWLVSCNTADYGCDGGWWAHRWHAGTQGICGGTGAVLEEVFPYEASELPCNGPYPHVFLVEDWTYVGSSHGVPSVESLKQAIYHHGPISAAVYVDSAFHYYTGGVFDSENDGTVNHAVALVGWNDDPGYWILRNSWDADWGEEGYMRIKYGCHSVGYSACYVDGYERISDGDETVNVFINQITNDGEQFEPIDPAGARAPEWYYKVNIGPDYTELNENLKEGTTGFWPWDWEHQFTWNVDMGHIAYVEDSTIDVILEVWDNDIGETDDQADITPKSGRTFNGKYNLITDKLVYSDDDDVPTEEGYYSITGTDNDNAKIRFDVTDSYNAELYNPTISVNPLTINFGENNQGSYTETLTISNTAYKDSRGWADDLDWSASDNRSWITLSKTSGLLEGAESDPITVTVNANDLTKGETHSGTITINSNDVTKTVEVSIKIKSKSKPYNYLPSFLQNYPLIKQLLTKNLHFLSIIFEQT